MATHFIYIPEDIKATVEDFTGSSLNVMPMERIYSNISDFDKESIRRLTRDYSCDFVAKNLGLVPWRSGGLDIEAPVKTNSDESQPSIERCLITTSADGVLILYGNEVSTKRFVERALIELEKIQSIQQIMSSDLFQKFASA